MRIWAEGVGEATGSSGGGVPSAAPHANCPRSVVSAAARRGTARERSTARRPTLHSNSVSVRSAVHSSRPAPTGCIAATAPPASAAAAKLRTRGPTGEEARRDGSSAWRPPPSTCQNSTSAPRASARCASRSRSGSRSQPPASPAGPAAMPAAAASPRPGSGREMALRATIWLTAFDLGRGGLLAPPGELV